jgi:serine/threonine protein phosphatase PrpC
MWKIAHSEIQGQGHIKKNIPCQDKTAKLIDTKHHTGNFYGLALADGAGSVKNSDKGAEFITNKILKIVKNKFAVLFKHKKITEELLKIIESELEIYAKSISVDIKELSSTLMFVAIKNDKFIIGHIGDGLIGFLDNNKLNILSMAENGEYSNSTFFTTSINYKNRLRIYKGELKKTAGFILMSNGSAESLFDKKTKKLASINTNIIDWLIDNSEDDVTKTLFSNLQNVISKKTADDCSIGIMRLV